MAVRLTEKGGKTRVAPVLNAYKDKISEVVDKNNAGAEKSLFTEYDSHIDNHAFRSEYATALMHQLEAERYAGKELCGGDFDAYTLVHLRERTPKPTLNIVDMTVTYALWSAVLWGTTG